MISGTFKNSVLKDYYSIVYSKVFSAGLQSFGTRWFHNSVEGYWTTAEPKSVLEIGVGKGEHLHFLKDISIDALHRYVVLDLDLSSFETPDNFQGKIELIEANAESLPFEDQTFDRVIVTCVLHHVEDPMSVLLEIDRVLKSGGEFSIALPTDPGISNRLIKFLITKRKMRKLGVIDPDLIYALEHRNKIDQLLYFTKLVFSNEDNFVAIRRYYGLQKNHSVRLEMNFKPFKYIKSWNLNLMVIIKGTKL